jgi:type IV pilus assembly protein PilA
VYGIEQTYTLQPIRNGSVEETMTGIQKGIKGFQMPQFSLSKLNKNEKGLTLIELLAVIVILAIIAAIAVPSITGIVGKTKKESHRANAQLIIDGARYKITVEDFKPDGGTGNTQTITLKDIVDDGFLEKNPNDPTGSGKYNDTDSKVTVTKNATNANKLDYAITLVGSGGIPYFTNIKEEAIKTETIVTAKP